MANDFFDSIINLTTSDFGVSGLADSIKVEQTKSKRIEQFNKENKKQSVYLNKEEKRVNGLKVSGAVVEATSQVLAELGTINLQSRILDAIGASEKQLEGLAGQLAKIPNARKQLIAAESMLRSTDDLNRFEESLNSLYLSSQDKAAYLSKYQEKRTKIIAGAVKQANGAIAEAGKAALDQYGKEAYNKMRASPKDAAGFKSFMSSFEEGIRATSRSKEEYNAKIQTIQANALVGQLDGFLDINQVGVAEGILKSEEAKNIIDSNDYSRLTNRLNNTKRRIQKEFERRLKELDRKREKRLKELEKREKELLAEKEAILKLEKDTIASLSPEIYREKLVQATRKGSILPTTYNSIVAANRKAYENFKKGTVDNKDLLLFSENTMSRIFPTASSVDLSRMARSHYSFLKRVRDMREKNNNDFLEFINEKPQGPTTRELDQASLKVGKFLDGDMPVDRLDGVEPELYLMNKHKPLTDKEPYLVAYLATSDAFRTNPAFSKTREFFIKGDGRLDAKRWRDFKNIVLQHDLRVTRGELPISNDDLDKLGLDRESATTLVALEAFARAYTEASEDGTLEGEDSNLKNTIYAEYLTRLKSGFWAKGVIKDVEDYEIPVPEPVEDAPNIKDSVPDREAVKTFWNQLYSPSRDVKLRIDSIIRETGRESSPENVNEIFNYIGNKIDETVRKKPLARSGFQNPNATIEYWLISPDVVEIIAVVDTGIERYEEVLWDEGKDAPVRVNILKATLEVLDK